MCKIQHNIVRNKILTKTDILILLLPALFFVARVIEYRKTVRYFLFADITNYIHFLILTELLAIAFVLLKKRNFLNGIIKRHLSIAILYFGLLCLKLFMLHLSEIDADSIYLFKILGSSFIEVTPLIILRPFIVRRPLKIAYIVCFFMIITLPQSVSF